MPRLSDFLARTPGLLPDRLTTMPAPARNPGALIARAYLPENLRANAPLVVALHGCTQNAAGYAHGTGWATLAEREGFALLLPEQTRANNPGLCFNWFAPADIARTGGEAESIAAMIEAMLASHKLDRSRVYVTGLSAGGAMTAAMLATYPELFAGGAIIAGLPYGCASGVGQALEAMRGPGRAEHAATPDAIRRASGGYDGPWPTVSIWHGTADTTVNPANLDALGTQWRGVHGLRGSPSTEERGSNWNRRAWQGPEGRDLVEEWRIAGMGHGVPLDADAIGAPGAYMLDVGISSTTEIARRWGIAESLAVTPSRTIEPPRRTKGVTVPELSGVQAVIERALRAGGLMRGQ